ncbi:hypothetical protein Trydic_g9570 [Trypoxylus dichotomus]
MALLRASDDYIVQCRRTSRNKEDLISYLQKQKSCDIFCLQESHRGHSRNRPSLFGMRLVQEIADGQYGSAVFISPQIGNQILEATSQNNIEVITVDFVGMCVLSVYKPPNNLLTVRAPTPGKAYVTTMRF